MDNGACLFRERACLKLFVFVLVLLIFYLINFHKRTTYVGAKDNKTIVQCFSGIQPLPSIPPIDRKTALHSSDVIEWVKEREALLSMDGTRKVLLFAYMRGGSTTGGEVFNQDPKATMWYEIADAFYMAYYGISEENLPQHDLYFNNGTRRLCSTDEQHSLTDFFTNQLTCQYDLLPSEAMAHHFLLSSKAFNGYTTCLGEHIGKDRVQAKCVRYIAPLCGNTVETSLTAKCHVILKYVQDAFDENADLVSSMKQTYQTIHTMYSNTFNKMVGKLRAKLEQSEHSFDPRIKNKLKWFILHRLCVENIREANQRCLPIAINKCQQSNIHVLQINRLKMEEVEPLLKKNPDLHVIYYVRDPRAIAVSRSNTKHMVKDITDIRPIAEVYHLCHKMAADLAQFRLLQPKYPGALQMVKYEKLVRHPVSMANEIYSSFGKESSSSWAAFAQRTMHASADGYEGSYVLKDAEANLIRWRKDVPLEQLTEMNKYCGPLLQELDYDVA